MVDVLPPFLNNQFPADSSTGIGGNTLISVDILDDLSKVNPITIDAYVNGVNVFHGPDTFIAPYNGPQSAITTTIIDGYDGYHLVLDNTLTLTPRTLYTVQISVRDNIGNQRIDSFSFGTGSQILSASIGFYEIHVDLTFGDGTFSNTLVPAYYTFNNGMYARYVETIDAYSVRLWVENFKDEVTFTLTLGSGITDDYGDSLPSPYNSVTISPPASSATLSNFNGKVRTWRDSNLISADSQRVYLAGRRGIDVFRKKGGVSLVRWAQVFDGYSVTAMNIAHFGGDHIFSERIPPYLSYQVPFPETAVPVGSTILLHLTDIVTAVEISSLLIYVNDIVAFSGSAGGWMGGFTGTIEFVAFQTMEIILIPPTPFVNGSTVVVQLWARDLLENLLEAEYQFYVGTVIPPSGTGGFGTSGFGTSSFGGA